MTKEQEKINVRRQILQQRIIKALNESDKAKQELKELCNECKHDGIKTWEQSASGNESCYICGLCGAEI
jgi:hypothetical protein